jgi:hypothetical protein
MQGIARHILILIFGSVFFVQSLCAEEKWTYREVTEDITILYTVSVIERSTEITTIQVTGGGVKQIHQLKNADGSTLSWRMTKAGRTIKAVRNGNVIELRVQIDGNQEIRILKIDEKPWIQFMGWGLQWLARRPEVKLREFWIFKLTDLSINTLVAEIQGEEAITIGDQKYDAAKVRVSVPGWLSKYWGVHIWFRKKDGFYLKFQGANGPPGTPETTTELIQEP